MSVTFSNHDEVKLYGLSTDNKPTTGIPNGSTFEESDTHIVYFYTGADWVKHSIGRTQSMPYLFDIAEGHIPDHAAFTKMGVYSAVGTTELDLWEGGSGYPWLTAAQTISVISSQAGDTAAGSGARTVYINYLNSAGVTGRETITLNGTAAVTSTNTMYRINSVVVASTGGTYMTTGTITVAKSAGGTALAYILAGLTRSRMCIYQVPYGKVLFITSVTYGCHSATKGIRVITRATYDADNHALTDFFLPYSDVAMTNGAMSRQLEIPTKLPAGTRLKVSSIADAAGAYATVGLRGWLENE
jgi:hypothetical protein